LPSSDRTRPAPSAWPHTCPAPPPARSARQAGEQTESVGQSCRLALFDDQLATIPLFLYICLLLLIVLLGVRFTSI